MTGSGACPAGPGRTPWRPATLRRACAAGYDVRLVILGGAGPASRPARRAGIAVAVATLEPDWRTADALAVVG